ncbi:unnamed protein product [Clonostachys rosea f. rosea IK726]|uniref:Beta-lactamase-related domain-containing protein n=2 Tax=Bionectria ochroleuca TaxID=29856 RepID=A0A0B7KGA0_BIOOC|nr:unnamed protein product [Clonostachys rosea f. rosea IK726]
MAYIHGDCAPQFNKIRSILQNACNFGDEIGVSFALDVDGKMLVDLYGGYEDRQKTRSWNRNTTVPIWSCSKSVTSLAMLKLVDIGILDPSARVSTYWPEFAANGKEGIKLRHIMSHTSGMSGIRQPITAQQAADGNLVATLLAGQAPLWPPTTASGYHTGTWRHLLGQVVSRTTGMTLAGLVQTQILDALRVDYFHNSEFWGNRADIVCDDYPTKLPVGRYPLGPVAEMTLRNPIRNADAPMTASAYSNARSLATILSTISRGGLDANGTQFLRPETVDMIFQEHSRGEDLVLQKPLRWGLGYALTGGGGFPDDEWLPTGNRVCYWGGWGGSLVVMDCDRRVTLAFTMNKMDTSLPMANQTARRCVRAAYEVLSA